MTPEGRLVKQTSVPLGELVQVTGTHPLQYDSEGHILEATTVRLWKVIYWREVCSQRDDVRRGGVHY